MALAFKDNCNFIPILEGNRLKPSTH
ncbi:hypothetical protein BVI1335_1370019 [Burkholderia vietnamiensis]|nr:hypothetical protein BVI1335_1370019 [Burkholderia vietnamiensis]